MKTVIITLNWNGTKNTTQLLQSYMSCNIQIPIWVVDNGSDIDDTEAFKEICPSVEIKKLDQNYGFAGGMNRAINLALEAGYEYVYEINNDCLFINDAISPMIEAIKTHPRLALLGSRYYSLDNDGNFTKKGFHSSEDEFSSFNENGILFTEKVVGCGMLIDCKIYKGIGGMEESYFCYCEENDYCHKLSRNSYKLGICFNSLIYHKHEQSNINGNSAYYRSRNIFLFYKRNKDFNLPILSLLKTFITQAIKSKDIVIKKAIGDGFIHGLIGKYGKRDINLSSKKNYYIMLLITPLLIFWGIFYKFIQTLKKHDNKIN